MADWTTLPNGAVGVGGLPSGTTVTALRDNPVAISEGAAGAPRNRPSALASSFNAPSASIAGTTYRNFLGLDPLAIVRAEFWLRSASTENINVGFSSNNGATWSGDVGLRTITADRNYLIRLKVNLSTGAYEVAEFDMTNNAFALPTATLAGTSINALRFRSAGPDMTGVVSLEQVCRVPTP